MSGSAESIYERRLDLAFAGLMSALFLGLLLVYGPVNIEQYHSSHPAVRVFHRGLFEGRYLFWTDAFGLGTPIPLGENLAFHPLLLFDQLLSLRWVLSVFWMSHLTVGGYYLLRLCRSVGVDSAVARFVAFGFIASPVTANYAYTDDWPSLFVGWTMLPVLIFHICRFAVGTSAWQLWRSASILVLLLSFVLWNSHLGYLVTLGSMFVCLVVFLSGTDRKILIRFTAVAGASALLASERLFFVASEALRFPPGVEKVTQGPVPFGAWVDQLYRPLSGPILTALAAGDLKATLHAYLTTMANVRIPFLGLVFFLAASWTVVSSLRGSVGDTPGRHQRAIAASFCLSVMMSLLPPVVLLYAPSAMWQFRDPATLFGLVAAGIALSSWRQRSIMAKRAAIWSSRHGRSPRVSPRRREIGRAHV